MPRPPPALLARHSRTFSRSASLLPVNERDAVESVYAFCRTTDDLSDEGVRSAEEREKKLDEWEAKLKRAYRSGGSADPVIGPFVKTCNQFSIPLRLPLLLVRGVRQDARPRPFHTFAELRAYSYRVASSVGLMLLRVFGVDSKRAVRAAVNLGIAFQLTNILRDLDEDERAGRSYLPLDEVKRFKRREDLLAFQAQRAQKYYSKAGEGVFLLPARVRSAVTLSALLYARFLEPFENHAQASSVAVKSAVPKSKFSTGR